MIRQQPPLRRDIPTLLQKYHRTTTAMFSLYCPSPTPVSTRPFSPSKDLVLLLVQQRGTTFPSPPKNQDPQLLYSSIESPFGIRAHHRPFIKITRLEIMERVGAASSFRERHTPPRLWGGFGQSLPLEASAAVRLSVHFFHDDQPTTSLAVWACVVGIFRTP